MRAPSAFLALALASCTSDPAPAAETPVGSPPAAIARPEPGEVSAPTVGAAPSPDLVELAVPPPAAPTVVDLLDTLDVDVAVSSAYHDDPAQVPHLYDGDPSTAWNSRTDDLVGAWIDVELPDGVQVTSIEMTAGFTREGGATDLFTGNHRVARVRVSLDGTSLGEHRLDTASRALQTLPVTGGPGVYRIEVIEVLPGSRSDWRETCISELRILGTAPPRPSTVGPPTVEAFVGHLPTAEEIAAEEAAVDAVLAQSDAMFDLPELWRAYDGALFEDDGGGRPEVPLPVARRAALERAADIVEPSAPERAATLRALVTESREGWNARRSDLDVVIEAIDAALGGNEHFACSWPATRAQLRIERVEHMIEGAVSFLAVRAESNHWDPLYRATPAEMAEAAVDRDTADDFDGWWSDVSEDWQIATRAGRTRLARRLHERTPPEELRIPDDWAPMVAAVDAHVAACADEPE